MNDQRLGEFLRRVAGAAGRFATASDREVLGQYVNDRDEAAFAELVRRHGAMVLGVCRRVLGNTPDAEDACQATFLVLARKAASVRRTDAVGAWLYRVARRASSRLRARAARHREVPLVDLPGPDTTAEVSWRDGLRVLDEELTRLPDAYRAPLVLCYLEGKTQDEAARQLGWTLGSFRGRLERARLRLRDRLDRRGVGLAVLAAVAAAEPASAGAVPLGIKVSILKAAMAVAAGQTASVVPAGVAAVAEGVIQAMTVTKLQWAAGVLVACGALTIGGVWATGQGPGLGPVGKAPAITDQPPAVIANPEVQPERLASASQRRRSLENLQKILLGVLNYESAFGHLPADIRDKNGKSLLSWRVLLLPYFDQAALYFRFKLDESWDSEHNLKLLSDMPPLLRVGIEPKDATETFYQMFAGPGTPLCAEGGPVLTLGGPGTPRPPGIGSNTPRLIPPLSWTGRKIELSAITDGSAKTIGVVEAGPPVPWTKPADIPYDPKGPLPKLTGPFRNVLHVITMDGAIWALKRDIDEDILRRLIVMNDGMPTPPLDTLQAPLQVLTPEEKEQLRKQIADSKRLIDQYEQVVKEHIALLNLRNQHAIDVPGGPENVEEQARWVKRLVDEVLRPQIKRMRDDMGLPPGAPIPKPPDRVDK